MGSFPDRAIEQGLVNSAQLDPAAFADFYERCEHPVLRFFMRATRRSDLAADLTAETFARALESIAVCDRCRGRADQWLFGIARNVLGESLRRGRVDAESRRRLGMPTLVLDDHTTDTIARLSSGQGEASVALSQLPTEQREAIAARVVDGREYAQIAVDLKCSEAVVRQRVSPGLRALRTRLTGER